MSYQPNVSRSTNTENEVGTGLPPGAPISTPLAMIGLVALTLGAHAYLLFVLSPY